MSNQVNVSFKVSGSELSNFINSIQKKSEQLTNDAIKGAIEQNNKGKENLKIIEDQIKAIERKTRIETQASRSISIERRETGLNKSRDLYEGRINDVFSDNRLSESAKKEKVTVLRGSQKENEDLIKNQYRENLTVIREQERQAKLQTVLAKENIDTLRDTAQKNVKAIQSGDLKLSDVIKSASTDEQKLVARLTEEGLREEKKISDRESLPGKGSGNNLFNSILSAENFNKALDFGSRAAQSKSGYDMIGATFGAVGNTAATLASDLPIVGAITKVIAKGMEAAGAFLERKAISGQNFYREAFRYNAITGSDPELNTDMQGVGVSVTDFIRSRGDYSRRRGYAGDSNETTRDAIYAEKGFGVDQGTSAGLVELQRSAKEYNRNLGLLLGGVLEKSFEKGILKDKDTTFFNEFLGKFSNMQRELLKSQTNVPTGTTMDILSRFNKLGGEFDLKDPRSMGNINAIQSGLSNPSSDNMRALAFRILSKQNPNKGIFDLNEEMSKGLGSPGYLKGVLEMVDQIGGGDQTKMMNLSGAFKGLSLSAVRRLYNNREGLKNGNLSIDELQAKFPTDFKGAAERNTTSMEKNAASIETQLLHGLMKSLDAITGSTSDAIVEAFSGAVININPTTNGGSIEFKRPSGMIKNSPKSVSDKTYNPFNYKY